MERRPPSILPVIIISQFAGTSLWFASNAVLADLQLQWNISSSALGYMTSAVQFGFIIGTLCFAFFALADRFSPSRLFFTCSIFGALSNLMIYLSAEGLGSLLLFRFITGFFLAGIYPVGMKIAASWYDKELGRAIGYLVGALVLGTSFPHLLKSLGQIATWETVILSITGISALGGVLMLLFVPDGPYLKKGTAFNSRALIVIFDSKDFRSASFGYFGHMWELYTFWAFVPIILSRYSSIHSIGGMDISFWSFCIIAAGSLGCSIGGVISRRTGSAAVAFTQLSVSGLCCLFSPLLFHAPPAIFLSFLLLWGITVVGDSPQFSALSAQTAPRDLVGSALTIVNCIGFSITIISIQLTNFISSSVKPSYIFWFLTIGPIFGLVSLWPLLKKNGEPQRHKEILKSL
jgi:predicted MFS family arabinose efflux permease